MTRPVIATMLILIAAAAAVLGNQKITGVARKVEHAASSQLSVAPPPPTLPANAPIPPTVIGMNVSGLSYYNNENALYDPIKNHGVIGIRLPNAGTNFPDLKDQVPQDAYGNLFHVPKGSALIIQAGNVLQVNDGLMCRISPGWQVSTLVVSSIQDGTIVRISRGKDAKDLDGWAFILTAQKDDASLTELSCRSPKATTGKIVDPAFLRDMMPFGIIRFMNWMRANDEPVMSWAKRPDPADLSFTYKGMPVETMVEIANELRADPWFTMPFGADDDYQRHFATYVRDHLAPGLKVYAELSNEIWNGSFPQSKQATMLGKAKYPSEDDAHANDYYYGDRVRHMMAIWSEVFAGQRQRLVRVASDQAAWPERADFLLGHADTAKSVDVLAIAPYFGGMPFDVPGTGAARVDGIFARMPQEIDKQIASGKKSKAIALKYGLRLVTYEAGTAYDAYEPDMVKDVHAVLHDPRLVPLYMSYISRWAKEIGGEMVLFDSTGGVWGHVDYIGQPWKEAPKMTAAVNVIATLPQGRERGIQPVTPSPWG